MVPGLLGSAITSRTQAVCQLYSNLKNSTREKQERTKALSFFFFIIFRVLCFPPGPVSLMDQYECHRCHMQVATSEENIETSLPCIPSQENPADLSPHPTPASFVYNWRTASQSLGVDPQSLGSFNIHSLGLILPWGLATSTTVNTKEVWSQGRKERMAIGWEANGMCSNVMWFKRSMIARSKEEWKITERPGSHRRSPWKPRLLTCRRCLSKSPRSAPPAPTLNCLGSSTPLVTVQEILCKFLPGKEGLALTFQSISTGILSWDETDHV